jgi:hypothetical protein
MSRARASSPAEDARDSPAWSPSPPGRTRRPGRGPCTLQGPRPTRSDETWSSVRTLDVWAAASFRCPNPAESRPIAPDRRTPHARAISHERLSIRQFSDLPGLLAKQELSQVSCRPRHPEGGSGRKRKPDGVGGAADDDPGQCHLQARRPPAAKGDKRLGGADQEVSDE